VGDDDLRIDSATLNGIITLLMRIDERLELLLDALGEDDDEEPDS